MKSSLLLMVFERTVRCCLHPPLDWNHSLSEDMGWQWLYVCFPPTTPRNIQKYTFYIINIYIKVIFNLKIQIILFYNFTEFLVEPIFSLFRQLLSWSSGQDAKQATHTEGRAQPVPTHAHIQRMIPNCSMPRRGISAFTKLVKKLINCQKEHQCYDSKSYITHPQER